MYSAQVRQQAVTLRAAGLSWSAISRALGVNRATLREWVSRPYPATDCPICDPRELDASAYAALLGYYLGDGCISRAPRYFVLRVSCDARYRRIIDDIVASINGVRPDRRVFLVETPGCVDVVTNWKHWPCLFPQHGPGRKHKSPILLEEWQGRIVEAHPGPFLRGLFHSDGCRVMNSTRKPVAGEMKLYRYPRWQFCNASADIRELCCWALDLVGVEWRQSNPRVISVSRRASVERLDELIGPKS